jgi:hypothetical protein
MDDTQLEQELAALESPQAQQEKPSAAEKAKPEGDDDKAKTETEENAEAETTDDAGGDASETEEQADGDEESEQSDEDEKPEPKRKKSGIARLKERLAAAEAEAASLRSRAPADSEPSASEIEKLIGKAPSEEDFKGDFLAYERALTAYEVDKRQVTRDLKGRATQAQEARQVVKREMVEAHQERIDEFREKVKDFDATLKGASNLKASPVVEDLILDSEKSAHIVYHLAKNPDRLAKLNAMSERDAAREIGRIEARLSLPTAKTQTQAPPPKAPPKGGSSPNSPEKDLDGYLKRTYGPRA